MKVHVNTALNLLNLVRQETDSIGIAMSFGKDSLCTLDLCSHIFPRIEAYYLFRVRDLTYIKEWSDYVLQRYKVKVRMYPHFDLSRCYKHAVLRPHMEQKIPTLKMTDIEEYFRVEANVKWLAMGWRRNDSFSRALIMKKCAGYDSDSHRIFPLRAFSRKHVYEYLEERNIPVPNTLGRKEQAGLDFHPDALKFLKENYPEDYKRWETDFPFSSLQLVTSNKTI